MRTKIILRTIEARHTRNPGEIARIVGEADTLALPENLLCTAADLARTIQENCRDRDAPDIIASYLLRWAFLLSQTGELVEAPPKPKRKKGEA